MRLGILMYFLLQSYILQSKCKVLIEYCKFRHYMHLVVASVSLSTVRCIPTPAVCQSDAVQVSCVLDHHPEQDYQIQLFSVKVPVKRVSQLCKLLHKNVHSTRLLRRELNEASRTQQLRKLSTDKILNHPNLTFIVEMDKSEAALEAQLLYLEITPSSIQLLFL